MNVKTWLIVGLLAAGFGRGQMDSCRANERPGKTVMTVKPCDGALPVSQQQPDAALLALRQFYVAYITQWTDDEKTAVLRERYLTRRLLDRLQKMYQELELDYDPFLKAQDCDLSLLDRLRIEPDATRPGVYRVYLWDQFNRKDRQVTLLLRQGEQGYQIDEILSLPED